MKNRHFVLLEIITIAAFHAAWAAYGGEGWFWLGWQVSLFILGWWGTSLAIRVGSPKGISMGFSASLGPRALYKVLPAVTDENGRLIWPESECWALGGGTYGGINVPESGEFAICRKGLAIPTAHPGSTVPQVFFNGYVRELSRPDHIKYKVFGAVRAHLLDPRTFIPPEWLDIVSHHPRWSWMDSRIFIIDVPVHPYIALDEAGDFALHGAKGEDPVKLRTVLPKIDEYPPETVLLDLVHRIQSRAAADAQDLRLRSAALENAVLAKSDKVTSLLNEITDINNRSRGQGAFGERARELISSDQESEGTQR